VVTTKLQTLSILKVKIALACALLLTTTAATAQWTGGIEGGTVLSGDDNASRVRLKLSNDAKPLSHYVYADWLRSDNGGNSFEVGYRPRYWFSEQLYVFGEARAKQDKPASIDREFFGLTGLGIQFSNTDLLSLWGELGAGYRSTEFENDLENSESTAVARAGFRQVLSDLVALEIDLDSDISETISTSTLETGIAVRVSGGALRYSYRTRRLKVEDQDSVSSSDSFVSFSYGF
jgi:putative salt-induced outer membrane protein YdiY